MSSPTITRSSRETAMEILAPVTLNSSADGDLFFYQPRAAIIPAARWRAVLTMQEMLSRGTHSYRDVFFTETTDGTDWTSPRLVASLKRQPFHDGFERVIGDACPKWHERSGRVLVTGKTFNFKGGREEDLSQERVSYCSYTPSTGEWSPLRFLDFPLVDRAGNKVISPNAGCVQRVDLPHGDILLPIRYWAGKGQPSYTTTVARCGFDGEELTYQEHGTEMTIASDRGFCEPSLAAFGGRYFLTLRNDHCGFVTRSSDGLNYSQPIPWQYDDGGLVPTYNTQQHWVTHSNALYLVYTRKASDNGHIMRHRAPLFIAQVNPDTLALLRGTEQVALPADGAELGNFGVVNASPDETWITAGEGPLSRGRAESSHRVLLVKIRWSKPNRLFPLN